MLVLDPTGTASLVATNFAGSVPRHPIGGDVRVLVQNGVGAPGLGGKARDKLAAAGMDYVEGGNAASFGTARTLILIQDGSQTSIAQGDEVATALGVPTSDVKITTQGQNIADVVVVLGTDFHP